MGTSWRDRWLALRDRCLSSPVFQHRASAFLLTRPTARRHARELFDLVAGFVYSQVLFACVQLRLFEILADGALPLEKLAERLALPLDAAARLLAAAASLRLIEQRSGGRYGLGKLGAPMVGNRAVAAMVEHHAALYADLANPVALLRSGGGQGALAAYWPYAHTAAPGGPDAESAAAYSVLMATSQSLVADQILDAHDLSRHRCLLDVGGGDGSFLCAAARRAPALQLMLFDLPAVSELARARFSDQGLSQRASVFSGSFLNDALPRGADIAALVRVIHDHDDTSAMTILRAVRQALPVGGCLLLAEPMSGTRGAEPMGDAYFGFYLLAMGKGRPRTAAELIAMLGAAGFAAARPVSTRLPLQARLIVAR